MSSAIAQTEIQGGFHSFSLDTRLLDAIDASGFSEPRPIQAETIPACLEGRDVMGLAQTGTGKTAAFALPILQKHLESRSRGTRTLILAPTRELATQIAHEVRMLAKNTKLSTLIVFGGVPMRTQLRGLKKCPDIVVGCPGRVLDLMGRGALDVSRIDTLVLDEADHMFDMGFLPDLRKILAQLPDERQNLLFSATMPKDIAKLANSILTDPHVVELAVTAPSERIDHFLYPVSEARKNKLLQDVLAEDDCGTAIVFMRTKHRAKRTAQHLAKQGRSAIALQGNMSQAQRDRAMSGFREGRFDVLVATDIAARGLDVAGIDYVVNYDVPNTPEAYTHRIGRTGRSEASGKACTFVTPDDRRWLRQTEKVLGMRIPVRGNGGDDFLEEEGRRGPRRRNGKQAGAKPARPTRRRRGARRRARAARPAN